MKKELSLRKPKMFKSKDYINFLTKNRGVCVYYITVKHCLIEKGLI